LSPIFCWNQNVGAPICSWSYSIWQLFENLPKIKYFLAYVNRSIGPTIKIILSVQDNFCQTFATVQKIPFLFLKYWYGDFNNCQKGILNPYLYYALNNESCMAKFQTIICHRSFVELKIIGLRYVARVIPGKSLKRKTTERLLKSPYQYFKNSNGIFCELKLNLWWEQWSNILIWQLFENLPKTKYFLAYVNRSIGPRVWKGKPRKVTTSGRKRRSMRKIERHVNLKWSGWPIMNGWITMTATTSWHAKYGINGDFCEDWRDEINYE
jgi:hypothetical protein